MPLRRYRLIHAFLVCVLQPVVPAATVALFGGYIWVPPDELARSIPPWVLLAIAATGAGAVVLVVGGALLRGGRLTLAEIGWRPERLARAIVLGVAGAAASTAALLGTVAIFDGDPGAGLAQMLAYSAYVLTACVYALWHFPMFRLDSMVARLGQGLVYGALRGRDHSLVVPAIAHALCWSFVGLY